MSCTGSCFQYAIVPLDGSKATRKGLVLSTRAISSLAGRRSLTGGSLLCACVAPGGLSRGARKMGLLMNYHSHWGRAFTPRVADALLPVCCDHGGERYTRVSCSGSGSRWFSG